MLKRQDAEDAVYSSAEVESLSIQLKAQGAPVDDLIQNEIDKWGLNTTQKFLVNKVIEMLRAELTQLSKKQGTTFFGRLWRKLWGGIFG